MQQTAERALEQALDVYKRQVYIQPTVYTLKAGHTAEVTISLSNNSGVALTVDNSCLLYTAYKLAHRTEEGRGVYTFCMCPGGEVITASSAEGMTVTNGMSFSARAGKFANSGHLVDVRTSDFRCV